MLTFDAIRDFERKEREGKALAKLPDDFMEQLKAYLRKKEKSQKSADDILELENVRNTIKRLLDARGKKLLEAAFDNARAGAVQENIALWEKEAFEALVAALKSHRSAVSEELSKPAEEKENREPMFRVKKALPEFVGPDMKTYALKKDDIVNIPSPLDELLLKEGVIEKAG